MRVGSHESMRVGSHELCHVTAPPRIQLDPPQGLIDASATSASSSTSTKSGRSAVQARPWQPPARPDRYSEQASGYGTY
eukprot:1788995-Rhodomonas_salina.2